MKMWIVRRRLSVVSGAILRGTATSSPGNVELKEQKKEAIAPVPSSVFLSLSEPKPLEKVKDAPAVPFDDIPGPISLRLVAKFWEIIPSMGTEMTISLLHNFLNGAGVLGLGGSGAMFKRFFMHYGPVVKLHGALGKDVVLLSRPEHVKVIFDSENAGPVRSSLDSVEKYRTEERTYRFPGPPVAFGRDWDVVRNSVPPPSEATILAQQRRVEEVCDDLIQRMVVIRNTQEEMPNDFKMEIFKWSLECLSGALLNKNLGFLDPQGVNPMSLAGRLLIGVTGATDALRKCEYGFHMWKFLGTPSWKALVSNCRMVDSVMGRYVDEAVRNLNEKKAKGVDVNGISLLEYLLLKEGYSREDVMTILLDMFLIGANSTAHIVTYLFYHLSKNARCQVKLNEEINRNNIDSDMRRLPYLQACIKECLRLNPPIPVINRVLSNDIIIDNYRIPKGTPILYATHLNNYSEEHFEDAHKFKPERWLNDLLGTLEFNEYVAVPFGHVPKSCKTKEMAEADVGMLVYQICKRFRIEFNYGELKSNSELFPVPSKPLRFRFIERKF